MMDKILIQSFIFGLLFGAMAYVFMFSVTLPDVWFSYSTGECVKVLNYEEDDKYSCENMPDKFYHVWVE